MPSRTAPACRIPREVAVYGSIKRVRRQLSPLRLGRERSARRTCTTHTAWKIDLTVA